MKKVFLLSVFAVLSFVCFAQHSINVPLNDVQVVTIVFPTNVQYVDFGSADIRGGKATHGNILYIKSEIPYFDNSSMSVVTTDGRYYGFDLTYSPSVVSVVYRVSTEGVPQKQPATSVLELSDKKTSHLIFSEPVTDVFIGCDSVIAGYADNITNIIRCKAVSKEMPPSILTMVTESGEVHAFSVIYQENPVQTSVRVTNSENLNSENSGNKMSGAAQFSDNTLDQKILKEYGRAAVNRGTVINNIGTISQNMMFGMYGLFIRDNVLMFHFNIFNDSNIDYDIDFIKIYIRDKKISKKTAVQEDELKPFYIYEPGHKTVVSKNGYSVVMFFNRFTIPTNRALFVEVFERNGGRHLRFSINNKDILQAKRL